MIFLQAKYQRTVAPLSFLFEEYSLEDLFQWSEYLQGTNSRAATPEAFVTRTYHLFEVGEYNSVLNTFVGAEVSSAY